MNGPRMRGDNEVKELPSDGGSYGKDQGRDAT
jgi:hypothetical protein